MNEKRFEELKASIVEAGMIMQGRMLPSREFTIERAETPKPPVEMWAVCLGSDDPKLLIPRKLYLVKFGETGVLVRDENGENVFCDKEDFLPLPFAHDVEELLELAA
ncbi:MAG TPA: hypothetical protein PLR83_09555 [Pyrinomonadaceae bacterium]|nr:hypothetical protein [Pyrinomonadaceae bacterium]